MSWIGALKEYNTGKKWCVPKKGSAEHAEVMALVAKMPKAVKTVKEPLTVKLEAPPVLKLVTKELPKEPKVSKKFKEATITVPMATLAVPTVIVQEKHKKELKKKAQLAPVC